MACSSENGQRVVYLERDGATSEDGGDVGFRECDSDLDCAYLDDFTGGSPKAYCGDEIVVRTCTFSCGQPIDTRVLDICESIHSQAHCSVANSSAWCTTAL